MALLSALLGGGAAVFTHDAGWLLGAFLILAVWPYTWLVIRPTNNRLHAIAPPLANAATRELLVRWGHLHAGRSVLGIVAVAVYLWALN